MFDCYLSSNDQCYIIKKHPPLNSFILSSDSIYKILQNSFLCERQNILYYLKSNYNPHSILYKALQCFPVGFTASCCTEY